VVAFLLSSVTRSPFMLLFELPAALVILHGVWARGWVVPSDPADDTRLRDAIPDEPSSSWLHDTADIRQMVWLMLAGLLLMGAIMVGPLIAKFVAIVIAVAVGCFVFFRGRRA